LEFDVRSEIVGRPSGPVKNNYRSVQTSTMLVNKAPSCLGCPTPSSVHDNDKGGGIGQVLCQRGQVPKRFTPVITQSSARETLLNKPDILVGDLIDLVGSSPPVDLSTERSTVNTDNFMVRNTLGASCSIPAKFVANGPMIWSLLKHRLTFCSRGKK